MIRIEMWPPPDWPEVIISWNTMLAHSGHRPNAILEWLDLTEGSGFHLHGWHGTLGFSFRFADPKDAVVFALRWGDDSGAEKC